MHKGLYKIIRLIVLLLVNDCILLTTGGGYKSNFLLIKNKIEIKNENIKSVEQCHITEFYPTGFT